jgi:hypothetical protein
MKIKLYHSYYTETTQYTTAGELRDISFGFIPCCDNIKSAITDNFLSLGEYDSYGLNKDGNINILRCAPYPEGAVWHELPIKYCPFCGEKIEIEEVEQ